MALSGLNPPAQLHMDVSLAMKWRLWFHLYEICAITSGITTEFKKKEQCCLFLQIAGSEAQTIQCTFQIDTL